MPRVNLGAHLDLVVPSRHAAAPAPSVRPGPSAARASAARLQNPPRDAHHVHGATPRRARRVAYPLRSEYSPPLRWTANRPPFASPASPHGPHLAYREWLCHHVQRCPSFPLRHGDRLENVPHLVHGPRVPLSALTGSSTAPGFCLVPPHLVPRRPRYHFARRPPSGAHWRACKRISPLLTKTSFTTTLSPGTGRTPASCRGANRERTRGPFSSARL